MNDAQLEDRQIIRELIDAWVIWRDGGDFERLGSLWRPDGFIMTTWCEATAAGVHRAEPPRLGGGRPSLPYRQWGLGGGGRRAGPSPSPRCRSSSGRPSTACWWTWPAEAVSATPSKSTTAAGDFFRVRPFTRGDSMAPVDLGAEVKLDPELLATFPQGYRHLGYLQTKAGLPVNKNLPGAREVGRTRPADAQLAARRRAGADPLGRGHHLRFLRSHLARARASWSPPARNWRSPS